MKFNNPYWSNTVKIGMLQGWIAVHSIIYYELCGSVISDQVFDNNAKQLVGLQSTDRKAAINSRYWYAFDDFDGSTGFDIYSRLNKEDSKRLYETACYILNTSKEKEISKK